MELYPLFLTLACAAYFMHFVLSVMLYMASQAKLIKRAAAYNKACLFLHHFCMLVVALIISSFFIYIGLTYPF